MARAELDFSKDLWELESLVMDGFRGGDLPPLGDLGLLVDDSRERRLYLKPEDERRSTESLLALSDFCTSSVQLLIDSCK